MRKNESEQWKVHLERALRRLVDRICDMKIEPIAIEYTMQENIH